ncbi:MAG: hypothetical protein PVJ60_02685 [Phycisphaerales bacterium]|jgi:hypothetical protein
MGRNDITVNGIILPEYIKDKELIKDEIERTELFESQTDTIKLGRHVKPKYESKKEKNGKVKILGNRAKNRYHYKRYLLNAIKSEKLLDAIVIMMMAHPTETIFTTKFIANSLDKICKENNMPVLKSSSHALRGRLGAIRKSNLSKYMFFFHRQSSENPGHALKYGIKEKYLNELTIDEAINLAYERREEFKDKNVLLNPQRSVKKNAIRPDIKPSPAENPVLPPPEAPSNLISEIMNQLEKLQSDKKSIIKVEGDLHIHINISR